MNYIERWNKNPDRLIIGIMSVTGYLYWSEHIRNCKFLQKNWYCRRAMEHENGNGKKKTYEKETNE